MFFPYSHYCFRAARYFFCPGRSKNCIVPVWLEGYCHSKLVQLWFLQRSTAQITNHSELRLVSPARVRQCCLEAYDIITICLGFLLLLLFFLETFFNKKVNISEENEVRENEQKKQPTNQTKTNKRARCRFVAMTSAGLINFTVTPDYLDKMPKHALQEKICVCGEAGRGGW